MKFNPNPNQIVERCKFNSIKHAKYQSAKDYVMTLKRQANKCNFGNTTDDMLRDQFVIEVFDERTRKRLLANAKLDLQKATDNLQTEEQVERDSKCFKPKIAQLMIVSI